MTKKSSSRVQILLKELFYTQQRKYHFKVTLVYLKVLRKITIKIDSFQFF